MIWWALVGAWISRMAGGGWPRLPWGMDQWFYAVPYYCVGFVALLPLAGSVIDPAPWWMIALIYVIPLIGFAGAFLGKRTGHGGFIDLGTWKRERKDERLEFIIKPLKGRISVYWYDVVGLTVTGLAVSLLAGLIVGYSNPMAAGLVAVSGGSKGIAYMIGWKIIPDGERKTRFGLIEANAIGEFLTGLFGWGILMLVLNTLLKELL